MIEYTINPVNYYDGILTVDIVPIDSSYKTLTCPVNIMPQVMEDILALPSVEEQKARIRKEIVKCNFSFQMQWEKQKKIEEVTLPSALLDLVGVPGTTKVTQDEVDSLTPSATIEAPVIL